MYNLSDTIAAISTPRGSGGIAGIRISGKESWNIAKTIFKQKEETNFEHMKALHGFIHNGEQTIDEVVLLPFKGPNSFTAEDVIEIFCHGGIQIPSMVLDLVLKNGGRLAKNGEFTFRGFISGRMDLTEAEAINEIINAESENGVLSISNTLSGSLKKEVGNFKDKLSSILASIESSIEFPMDVDPANYSKLKDDLTLLQKDLQEVIKSSKEGRLLKNGIKTSIIGKPNAGKSSLLNSLIENDRAIVTSTPGTTRDIIEERAIIDGWPFVFIDTAGIRGGSLDKAEEYGIERSKQSIKDADIVLYINDVTSTEKDCFEIPKEKAVITIGNKVDLVEDKEITSSYDVLVSAKFGININELKSILKKIVQSSNPQTGKEGIYINERQKSLLMQMSNHIDHSLKAINDNTPEDLIADELKKAISKLDEISGAKVNEDVITDIFQKFCIGK